MQIFKKVLISVAFIALAWFGVYQINKSKQAGDLPVKETPPTTEVDTTTGIFTNTDFTLEYQKDVIAKDYNETSTWRTNTETDGGFHVGILIPGSLQPNTNFREAKFTVGSSSDSVAITECLLPTNGERAKGEVTINDVVFKKITLTNAGAGNYYDTTSYRTMHEGICYAVEYTIHSTNIGNYSPEQNIKEFDTAFIVKILEDMVKSFEFK